MATNPFAYSDEGTIAHELATICLTENRPASAFVGRLLTSEEYPHAQLSPSTAHRWMRCVGSHALESRVPFKPRKISHQVDEEMAKHVQTYVDAINKMVLTREGVLFVEQKLPIERITGEKDAFGRGDCIIVDMAAFELQAHDLKYGAGVEVDAEDNEQLAMYLCAAMDHLAEFEPEGGWQSFRGFIHQPRIHDEPYEFTWNRKELHEFRVYAHQQAQEARRIKEQVDLRYGVSKRGAEVPEGSLVPGDKQCRFCSAKAQCPALQRQVQETTLAELGAVEAPVPALAELADIPADSVKLSRLKAFTPLLRSWCDAIDAHTEAVMLAGEPVPGWKVVEGRRGNRAWDDPEEVEKTLKAMRLKQEEMYSFKLISPTAAEKLVDSKALGDRQWKRLQQMITQSPGKPTVVPENDRRPALIVKPVVDELMDNSGDDLA